MHFWSKLNSASNYSISTSLKIPPPPPYSLNSLIESYLSAPCDPLLQSTEHIIFLFCLSNSWFISAAKLVRCVRGQTTKPSDWWTDEDKPSFYFPTRSPHLSPTSPRGSTLFQCHVLLVPWKKYSFKISCLKICLRRSSIWDVERSLLRFHITCQENNFGFLSLSWHTAFHFLNILESVNIGEYWTQFNSKCWHHLTSNVMYIG